jgi:hypothetical protein
MPGQPARPRTLAIRPPFGRVLAAALAALTVILAGCELLARSEAVQAGLAAPSVNGDVEIGSKLLAIDRLAAQPGQPDCVIVGSSMVDDGIDPDGLSAAYNQRSGRSLTCFNFGIKGTDALGAARVATALLRAYHPRLIIFGTSFRDYLDRQHSLDIPWTRFYAGRPSLEGWLEAHSYAYRYGLTYRSVLRDLSLRGISFSKSTASGFHPGGGAMAVDAAALAADSEFAEYARWSDDYSILPEELVALDQLLALASPDLAIVVVEMPLPPAMYATLPNGLQTRQTFVDTVNQRAAASRARFWPTWGVIDLPDGAWRNPFHLNGAGADLLGRWLGDQIAAGVADGQLTNPTP